MKTKPFLLATAGSTVDGRVIDGEMIKQMASSYDPKTYGARLNIEHVRGWSGEAPFRAYGDVLELSTGEVDVNFNGTTEKRLALYGVFDVTEDAKKLNDAGQKVYPSIEIEPNFGGKGHAYLMGCALTDSPASIATERLAFNRRAPGLIHLSLDDAALLEAAEEAVAPGEGLLTKIGGLLDGFAAKFASSGTVTTPAEPAAAPSLDFAELKPLLESIATNFAAACADLRTDLTKEIDQLGVKLGKLEAEQGSTEPAQTYTHRPQANGTNGKYAKTDC